MISKHSLFLLILFPIVTLSLRPWRQVIMDDWGLDGRIAAYWIDYGRENIEEMIRQALMDNVNVILTWPPGEGITLTDRDVEHLSTVARLAHREGLRVLVYRAPLEHVTLDVDMDSNGVVDPGKSSLYTEHPEWLQVGISGDKAVFYGNVAFWVPEHAEDVRLCPNDPEYREIVVEDMRRLASTGVDGVWIDVPKLQCDFADWEDEWACHCEDCKALFKAETGYDIPGVINWESRVWKTWILWRQKKIASFIKDIREAVRDVNPNFKVVVEHWRGVDAETVREAWSPLVMRDSVDWFSHEYHSATCMPKYACKYLFLRDLATYRYYRALDCERPSWAMSYSTSPEGQRMLAAGIVFSDCNYYDAKLPYMTGSASYDGRSRIFSWIDMYDEYYYGVSDYSDIAVYYSEDTLRFGGSNGDWEGEYYMEFMGVSMMLLDMGIPYRVVTSITRLVQAEREGYKVPSLLILPDVRCISSMEHQMLNEYLERGGSVLLTGPEPLSLNQYGDPEERSLSDGRVYRESRLLGVEYYLESDSVIYTGDGNPDAPLSEFRRLLEGMKVYTMAKIIEGEDIVLKLDAKGDSILLKVLNLKGVAPGVLKPESQLFKLEVDVSPLEVASIRKLDFLGGYEELSYIGDGPITIEAEVLDHCTIIINLKLLVVTNDIDYQSALTLKNGLKQAGILNVELVSPDTPMITMCTRLVIVGGHRAPGTGILAAQVLNKDEKDTLEVENTTIIVYRRDVWRNTQAVLLIAGTTRNETRRACTQCSLEAAEYIALRGKC